MSTPQAHIDPDPTAQHPTDSSTPHNHLASHRSLYCNLPIGRSPQLLLNHRQTTCEQGPLASTGGAAHAKYWDVPAGMSARVASTILRMQPRTPRPPALRASQESTQKIRGVEPSWPQSRAVEAQRQKPNASVRLPRRETPSRRGETGRPPCRRTRSPVDVRMHAARAQAARCAAIPFRSRPRLSWRRLRPLRHPVWIS